MAAPAPSRSPPPSPCCGPEDNPAAEECIPVAEDEDEDEKTGSWFGRVSFGIKYKLYTSTPVGRWFHNKQLKAWKDKSEGRPHCAVAPVMWDDVVVETIPLMHDNYCYLVITPSTREAIVVDVCDAETVLAVLKRRQLTLTAILTTHGHHDHSFGNKALKAAIPGLKVFGTSEDGVPGLTDPLPADSEARFTVAGQGWRSLPFPGHTKGLVLYVLEPPPAGTMGDVSDQGPQSRNCPLLFSGDGVFVSGTGRMFEGKPETMYASLAKLQDKAAFPDNMLLFPGHEYSLVNLLFSYKIDGANPKVAAKLKQSIDARAASRGLVPTTLGEERCYNPFLRLREFVHLALATEAEAGGSAMALTAEGLMRWKEVRTLAHLRAKKDVYSPSETEYQAACSAVKDL